MLVWFTALALSFFSAPSAVAAEARGLRPDVLRLAVEAADCADSRGLVESGRLLTVIDYSLPSVEPRLWVVDR